MAQNEAEQARDRVKALIKSGVTDITKLLPKHESEDEEDLDDDEEVPTTDPLAGKDEDFVRWYNDSRRKAYEVQKASFAEADIDFRKTALGKLKQDSVGIFANIDNKLVAMKHIDANENRITDNTLSSKWILTYNGSTSNYQFLGEAHFRLYFTHDKNSISEYYKMFSNNLRVNDFIVCKLKTKNNKREFIGARNASAVFSDGHTKSKADAADVIVSVNKVSENVYDMTVKGTPGEYCLTWNEKESASWTIFDFTIR